MHSGGIAIGLLPDIIHLLLFKCNLTFLNVIKCETDTENPGEKLNQKVNACSLSEEALIRK